MTHPPQINTPPANNRATWAKGDFAVIGVTFQIIGELLAEAVDINPDERVLDIAAGNGNATLAAARRQATVTSTDIVPELLDKGAARATAEGLKIKFVTADAQRLPFERHAFDVCLSTFGAMFAPDHELAAGELSRVLRSGGRVGLTTWTPQGFVGQMSRLTTRYVPPPAGAASPMLWGTEDHIHHLFGSYASQISIERKLFKFRYRSPEHFINVYRSFFGPTQQVFESLSASEQSQLTNELTELLRNSNTGGTQALVIPAEYLEIVAIKR
ncbi:class I SAM-dependent methyltransferase [Pandoraea pnomenusa]|uniref:class I SAM-dependent methyltransferase n=1 Tax=Pandoraea pnomenusa TaxID=93220 RepID=UPI00333F0788